MAFTLTSTTPVSQGVEGNRRFKVWNVTGPASYATGGDAFAPSAVGMSRIDYCVASSAFYNGTSLVQPHFPPVNSDGTQNLIFEWTSGVVNTAHAQVPAATNLSGYTGLIKVIGT